MRLEVVTGRQDALLDEDALERVDELEQLNRAGVADVVDAVSGHREAVPAHLDHGRVGHDPRDALDDVLDVGEVAPAVAHVEDLDRLAPEQLVREPEIRHVGATHGPVHRKEAQPGGGDGVQLGVRGGHELVRLLGRGVEGYGGIDHIGFRKRHLLVTAVH